MQSQEVIQNKRTAFMELYEPIHDRFIRFCHARVNNEDQAHDLINETLLRAYENFDKLRSREAFLYFLFGIATRVLHSQYRKMKYWGAYEEQKNGMLPDTAASPEDLVEVQMLYKALDQLPEKQREALILFEISGFSIKEIQEIQQSKSSAVKARLMRGRRKLAKILQIDDE